MTATVARWTLADLANGGGPPGLWEIIEGALIEVSPAGGRHARIAMRLVRLLGPAADEQGGVLYGPDAGFILQADPLVLRVPDVAFVSQERLPADFDDGGYLRVAPDLVTEVVSPSDRTLDVLAKVILWLEHGVRLVWVVDPAHQTVFVYAADVASTMLTSADTLTGGELLPQFSVPVAAIFAR